MDTIHNIYDKIFKKLFTLSVKSVIYLINGLFGTDYPADSEIKYDTTENVNNELRTTVADIIITINHTDTYHLEAQMKVEGEIILRVFDYGYQHATRHWKLGESLNFPKPMIIYLYRSKYIPDYYEVPVKFGGEEISVYKVETFKYIEKSLEEINRKKLIILIPFQLLKLRKEIEKKRTPENMLVYNYYWQ